MEFTKKWVDHLRNNHKQEQEKPLLCALCGADVQNRIQSFRNHVTENPESHQGLKCDDDINHTFKTMKASKLPDGPAGDRPKRHASVIDDPNGSEDSHSRKRRSPSAPAEQPERTSHPGPYIRSRARNPPGWNTSGRVLWNEGDPSISQGANSRSVQPSSTARPQHQSNKHPAQSDQSQGDVPCGLQMMLQPETRPISQDQLVAEVKGIYAGLVMVETKCIEVDNAQSSNSDANKLNNEQWQALIALHRTLLHEHHDFFLASQHPSASAPLRRLASKNAMPARMWRHGIHSFLELLRHRLPASLEHMLTFLYLAYSMMALLYETVPAFEDTWIECLGDLGRYRIAIEDDDIRDREVWTGVSRHWYSKASDKSPTTGRLYHHLAILARPNALQQLYCYAKSLCVPIPFLSAKESIMTLFDPVLSTGPTPLSENMEEFLELVHAHTSRATKRWLEAGYFIPLVSLPYWLLSYEKQVDTSMASLPKPPNIEGAKYSGSPFPFMDTDQYRKLLEYSKLFLIDISIEHLCYNSRKSRYFPMYYRILETATDFANHILHNICKSVDKRIINRTLELPRPLPLDDAPRSLTYSDESHISGEFITVDEDELPRRLPQDYVLQGLTRSDEYYPRGWFINDEIDEDEKYFELASMVDERNETLCFLGDNSGSVEYENLFDAAPTYHESKWTRSHCRQLEASANSKQISRVDSTMVLVNPWSSMSQTITAC